MSTESFYNESNCIVKFHQIFISLKYSIFLTHLCLQHYFAVGDLFPAFFEKAIMIISPTIF